MFRRRSPRELDDPGPPRWLTPYETPRILIEHADPEVREPLVEALTARGFDVISCAGPQEGSSCPLLRQEPCPAVDGADAVVTGLTGSPTGRVIARRIRRQDPDRILVVEGDEHHLRDLANGTVHALFPLEADAIANHLAADRGIAHGRET